VSGILRSEFPGATQIREQSVTALFVLVRPIAQTFQAEIGILFSQLAGASLWFASSELHESEALKLYPNFLNENH
jgi:hypothetical protein